MVPEMEDPPTVEEELEYGRYDVEFWAWRFLGVRLHPGQVRLADAYVARQKGPRWWTAAYLTICLAAGNRAGKTLVMAVVILHACFYKMGLKPPSTPEEAKRWNSLPYVAYHFAIQQDVARLVFDEITNMLQGIHVAQKDGDCPLVSELRFEADWSKKDGGEYDYIVFGKDWGGAEIKFRTTMGGKGKGSLGRDMHLITFDEAGIEPNLKWINDNVIHLRRLGTGGQVFYFSTPEEGLTDFADLWFLGDPEQPDRRPRRMSLRMSTRDNVGYGLDAETFEALVGGMDEDHVKQNIDGYFIQGRTAYFNHNSVDRVFTDELPETRGPRHKHQYAQGLDPAIKLDAMWSIVFDVKEGPRRWDAEAKEWVRDIIAEGVRVEKKSGSKTVEGIVELGASVHAIYTNNRNGLETDCTTGVDSTSMGGHMFRQLLDQSIPGGVRSIEFGGNTLKKRKLLNDLRVMLDKGWLKMPRTGFWLEVRRQLLGYKIDDRHIEQDAVMTLAVAVAVIRTMTVGGHGSSPFNAFDVSAPIVAPPLFNPRKRRLTSA